MPQFLIKLQRVIINRIYFNTFGVGFIFGVGGGGGWGLKIGCILLFTGRWAYNF